VEYTIFSGSYLTGNRWPSSGGIHNIFGKLPHWPSLGGIHNIFGKLPHWPPLAIFRRNTQYCREVTDPEARVRFPALPEKKVVGMERGPLSLLSTTEELRGRKVAAPVYKTENTAVGISHTDHVAPSIRKSWQSLRRQAAVARSV
jgi:hypothetical protein